MLLKTKGIVRCLGAALKTTGYVVRVSESRLAIGSMWWCVSIEYGKVPRTLLGTIVAHVGYIPHADCPLFVRKIKSEVIAEPADREQLAWLLPLTQLAGEDRLICTEMQLMNDCVLQKENEPRECFTISNTLMDMVRGEAVSEGRYIENGRVFWDTGDSKAVIRLTVHPVGGDIMKILTALEQCELPEKNM